MLHEWEDTRGQSMCNATDPWPEDVHVHSTEGSLCRGLIVYAVVILCATTMEMCSEMLQRVVLKVQILRVQNMRSAGLQQEEAERSGPSFTQFEHKNSKKSANHHIPCTCKDSVLPSSIYVYTLPTYLYLCFNVCVGSLCHRKS
jgi:hypothetical protein